MSQVHTTAAPQKADRDASSHDDQSIPEQPAGVLVRAMLNGGMPLKPRHVLQLQRTLGNQATINLLQTTGSRNVQRRVATDAERMIWLGFFDHYLPRELLNHYMDDTGVEFRLNRQKMIDCNPDFNIRFAPGFVAILDQLYDSSGGALPFQGSGRGVCMTNGTLGNFTVHYNGMVTMDGYSQWSFVGTVDFYDYWDFDPQEFGRSGRTIPAELRVRVADMTLPGRPFRVTSEAMTVWQTRYDDRIQWAGSPPEPVIDPASEIMGTDAAVAEEDAS